ncbi:MAG: nicotinamide mononucleotide transporter [Candidatus Omnitrophica bacterium]|nr:nicotinamide mononucleotide transporter [Candidatus Omnitrophota bacterium]
MWFLTILSIFGVILNIQKKRSGFLVWMTTNASWCAIDFQAGLPAQGVLFLIYFGLAGWGWLKWGGGR